MPLFRKNAPKTSVDAALSLNLPRLEALVLDTIRRAGDAGMTAEELLKALPDLSYSSVTARPASLKEKGFVVDSGEVRPGRTGRNQKVLVAVEFAKVA